MPTALSVAESDPSGPLMQYLNQAALADPLPHQLQAGISAQHRVLWRRRDARGALEADVTDLLPSQIRLDALSTLVTTTAAPPSGLMLKAKNINGSLPGFAHWWTKVCGS